MLIKKHNILAKT